MQQTTRHRLRGRRALPLAGAFAGLAAAVLLAGGASGEPGNGMPEIQVLPSPTGVAYGQTVQVKGDDLPEGSGFIAATICGLTDEAGAKIPEPVAGDCAGQPELGTLVVLQENKDGTFDQPYTLPQSGQRFGENQRFCDATHHCALVLADANPDAPAYHVDQVIQFTDQQPFGGAGTTPDTEPATTTTAPPPPAASASTTEMSVGEAVDVNGERWDAAAGDTGVGFVDSEGHGTSEPVRADVDASGALHVTLTARFHDIDATAILVEGPGTDGATHSVVIPITVHPQPGVSGRSSSEVHLSPDDPHVRVRARIVVTPPDSDGGSLPAPVAEPVQNGCEQLADQLAGAGADPTALTTACNALVNGGGGQQLQLLLHQPTALCIALAPAAGGDPQFTAACAQALGAAAPVTGPLGDAARPLTDALP